MSFLGHLILRIHVGFHGCHGLVSTKYFISHQCVCVSTELSPRTLDCRHGLDNKTSHTNILRILSGSHCHDTNLASLLPHPQPQLPNPHRVKVINLFVHFCHSSNLHGMCWLQASKGTPPPHFSIIDLTSKTSSSGPMENSVEIPKR